MPLKRHTVSLCTWPGAGEWVCVVPASPVDRSNIWLQAARARSSSSSQRLQLPVLWGSRNSRQFRSCTTWGWSLVWQWIHCRNPPACSHAVIPKRILMAEMWQTWEKSEAIGICGFCVSHVCNLPFPHLYILSVFLAAGDWVTDSGLWSGPLPAAHRATSTAFLRHASGENICLRKCYLYASHPYSLYVCVQWDRAQ